MRAFRFLRLRRLRDFCELRGPRKPTKSKRSGFTLLELMLSLALIVVATGLIGYLLQMYSRNFASRSEEIRRMELVKDLLNMVAVDIRSVVTEIEYDGSVLEQQLGASSSQSGGGQAGAGATSGLGDTSGLGSSGTTGTNEDSSLGGLGDSTSSAADTATVSTEYPPGIYGTQNALTVEVSRLPRQEEYYQEQGALLEGDLKDVPSDIKTVSYFIQAPSIQGVTDDLSVFDSSTGLATGFAGGLVRRALDRGITAFAEDNGDTSRLARSGVLVAPEVIALEFAYFDGELAQWVYEWDSSQQGLPWLVQITIGIQDPDKADDTFALQAGTFLSALTLEDRRNLGIEVFELVVAIPGANLTTDSAESADAAAGMDSLGL